MSIGQFLKFVNLIGSRNIVIKYFDYDDMGKKFIHEFLIENLDHDFIVCAYLMLLEDNEVHVFFRYNK